MRTFRKEKLKILAAFLFVNSVASTTIIKPAGCETFLILDPQGAILTSIGDITTQLSPCSTFKIALSLIGYDLNILIDDQLPQWDFHEGNKDFFSTTPSSWMQNSYVWYSQILSVLIGKTQLQNYLALFDYGNQNLSGDDYKNNGLTNAWLNSSLKISPLEQVKFLQKITHSSLPVSPHAIAMTKKLIFIEELPDGWNLFGKTGLGDKLGWLVGWVEKEGLSYPFAFVKQDTIIIPSDRLVRVKQLIHEIFLNKETTMRTFRKEKLARDKTIQRFEACGAKAKWRYLNDEEYNIALRNKLVEEADEVKVAKSREELVDELADLYEVIDAIKAFNSLTEEEIITGQTKKREERGGFSKRIYVEKTAYPKGSHWDQYCLENPDKYPVIDEDKA